MHVEAFLYIMQLCERLPGTPTRAAKRDVKAAFKLVWVAFSDMCNFATQLPTEPLQGIVNAALGFSIITVVFSVLIFGWAESPSNYGSHGWLLSEALRRSGPEFWYELPSLAFFCLTFVDDGVLIGPVLGQRCVHSGGAYDWSIRRVLGWALNLKKLALEGVFSPLVLLWGILVNLTLAEKGAFFVTCEMPQAKVEKAVVFVGMTTHQPGCRSVTEKQHAELAGNVQWWATTAPALRAVLPPIFAMSSTDSPGWVSPVGDDATKAK